MADELKVTLSTVLTNGNFKDTNQPGTISIDQDTQGFQSQIVTVTSSATVTLGVSTLTTLGRAFLRNLDATNFISWGPQSSTGGIVKAARIYPGDVQWVSLNPGTTYLALASTTGAASANLLWKVYEK